ncbi:helix-turn-helix domain-containing protein [Streptomyces sp. B21-083]|uniref:helix-turn-helix domain-containing protein n=1 Tax=Streptomyces sp. B21-083 TaxID=3039410 RepID=UPI002FEF7538
MLPYPSDGDDWLLHERRRIGRHIRNARIDHSLTQEQVFLAASVNRSFYQQIEGGDANPSLETLLRIARAIGVTISELLRG